MRKTRFVAGFVLLSASLLSVAAHAETLSFTLNGDGSNYVFTLDSHPTGNSSNSHSDHFTVIATDTQNAANYHNESTSFSINTTPGVDFGELSFTGDQIYTGPITAPTFAPGTFNLEYYGTPYTLNIASVAAAPEPSSLVLLGTGALGAFGIARRRFRR